MACRYQLARFVRCTIGSCIVLGAAQVTGRPEDEAHYIFQQLLVAIDYCHRLGIANRDIKARYRTSLPRSMIQNSYNRFVLPVLFRLTGASLR